MGPAPDHYRCLKIYNPTTRSEIVLDTIKFIPKYVPIPEASIDDHIRKTANDLVHLLLNKSPAIPALQLQSSRQALIQIAQTLNRDTTPVITSIPPPVQVAPSSPSTTQILPQSPFTSTAATPLHPINHQQTPEERLCEYYLAQQSKQSTNTLLPMATSKGVTYIAPENTSKGVTKNSSNIHHSKVSSKVSFQVRHQPITMQCLEDLIAEYENTHKAVNHYINTTPSQYSISHRNDYRVHITSPK